MDFVEFPDEGLDKALVESNVADVILEFSFGTA